MFANITCVCLSAELARCVSLFVTRVLKECCKACCILSPNVASSTQMSEEIESDIQEARLKKTTLHIKRLEKVRRQPGIEGNTGCAVKREYRREIEGEIVALDSDAYWIKRVSRTQSGMVGVIRGDRWPGMTGFIHRCNWIMRWVCSVAG